MKYIKQQIEKQVLELGKAWSAILLTGPGQVEKITMLWGLVKREDNGRKYVSLDDLNTQEVAKSDLNKFLKIHKPSVLINEVQYPPELFQRIWNSCMPIFISGQVGDRNVYDSSYLSIHVERDIRVIFGTVEAPKLVLFIAAATVHVLQLINYGTIANYEDIDQLTYKNWINILETLGIVFLLYRHSGNERMTKTPEMYFYVCYLTGLSSPEAAKRGAVRDELIQRFHLAEIMKDDVNEGREPYLHHYRDWSSREDDLLFEGNGKLFPLEIRKSDVQNKLLLKRVIELLSSYVVNIDENGNVSVDGNLMDEPYLAGKNFGECNIEFPYQVPNGKLFMMGNNWVNSIGNRSLTVRCIDEDKVIGTTLLRIWPLNKMSWMR